MLKRIKGLGIGALTLLLLGVASPAMALPEDCDVVCSCSGSCLWKCSVGTSVITCGQYGICAGKCLTNNNQTDMSQASAQRTTEPQVGVCKRDITPEWQTKL